jgi:structural maintenance of chromosome 2
VAFGGVWKDSLSELSGGQKSLLALSLILAMLLFKPAPIYILDEVDAALDLSHTQNIGRMIKTHFPQSQVWWVGGWEGGWVWMGSGASNASGAANLPDG